MNTLGHYKLMAEELALLGRKNQVVLVATSKENPVCPWPGQSLKYVLSDLIIPVNNESSVLLLAAKMYFATLNFQLVVHEVIHKILKHKFERAWLL